MGQLKVCYGHACLKHTPCTVVLPFIYRLPHMVVLAIIHPENLFSIIFKPGSSFLGHFLPLELIKLSTNYC